MAKFLLVNYNILCQCKSIFKHKKKICSQFSSKVALRSFRYQSSYLASQMEKIINNPGLQYLVEKIFRNMDNENLKICAQINYSCQKTVENPIFWLKKFRSFSNNWIKVIQSVKNTDREKYVISYLKWNLKKGAVEFLPCYTSPAVQDDFRKTIRKICKKKELCDEDTEIVKIYAHLTDSPNAPNKDGVTSIHVAACRGHTEIINILAPFAYNPNAPDNDGITPISWAASHGHTEIVKILAPLTDNPNVSDKDGCTPIGTAAFRGHIEIVNFLAPLTDNPNAPNKYGETPIY